MQKNGFTLLEILVVIGMTAFLFAIATVYTRRNEVQLVLFRERATVYSNMLRSKALATQAFRESGNTDPVCGYGVHIENTRVVIFKEFPVTFSGTGGSGTPTCAPTPDFYSGDLLGESVSEYKLDERTEIRLCPMSGAPCTPIPTTLDVLFVPPDPQVFFSPDSGTASEWQIGLFVRGSTAASTEIIINRAGQIAVGF